MRGGGSLKRAQLRSALCPRKKQAPAGAAGRIQHERGQEAATVRDTGNGEGHPSPRSALLHLWEDRGRSPGTPRRHLGPTSSSSPGESFSASPRPRAGPEEPAVILLCVPPRPSLQRGTRAFPSSPLRGRDPQKAASLPPSFLARTRSPHSRAPREAASGPSPQATAALSGVRPSRLRPGANQLTGKGAEPPIAKWQTQPLPPPTSCAIRTNQGGPCWLPGCTRC